MISRSLLIKHDPCGRVLPLADGFSGLAPCHLVPAPPAGLAPPMRGRIPDRLRRDFLGFGLPSGSPSLGELLQQGKNNPQSPWLGLVGFFTLAVLLSLWLFIGEGVRDAFNPRKIYARAK